MKNIFFYKTAIGRIGIAEENNAITNLYHPADEVPDDLNVHETQLLKNAGLQLEEYLAGQRKQFDLPLDPAGTKFMQDVWKALCAIPFGETQNYQEIARIAGSPGASRAAGLACKRNPISIFIPCHRVIGKNGKLTGYRHGLKLKERLLELEREGANL